MKKARLVDTQSYNIMLVNRSIYLL